MKNNRPIKITEKIQFILDNMCTEMDWNDVEDIVNLTHELEVRGFINFCVIHMTPEGDSWLEAHHYSKKLDKEIIWDFDFPDSFADLDDFAETVMLMSSEICEFEKKIHLS